MAAEETSLRIKHFLDAAKGMSASEFIERHPSHVMVVVGSVAQTDGEFLTRAAASIADFAQMKSALQLDPNARVFLVEKRPDANPYSKMIIIGRAPNCDISLPRSEVSKMHAFVTWTDAPEGKTFMIVDGKSRNGTWIANTKLPPNTPRPLQNGDLIGLGRTVGLHYYNPAGFFSALSKMTGS
ncbi:MAG: FHA domain-containing protein [Myxococcota bacterium]|jgi:hypothetical protein|nr:FHA domain-containing protein [Myxococcota bacterium]